jgi:riboflavin kinase / FMN adenylyltransferase
LNFKLSNIIPDRSIGRTLGFPTLNFEIPKNFELEEGVYVCRIKCQVLGSREQVFFGVLFYGNRKTFDNQKALEIHIIDKNLKNSPIKVEVEVVEKIREVEKFEDEEKLKEQIAIDCEKAKIILNL